MIPDASASLVPLAEQSADSSQMLEIALSQQPSATEIKDPFAYASLGWRARLVAASLASEVEGLRSFRVTAPGVSVDDVPPAALGEAEGTLPDPALVATQSKLGTISEAAARKQLESNVEVLRGALPQDTVSEVSLAAVPVNSQRDRFAFEAILETKDAAALVPYFGDIFLGLQTGLVGSEEAVADGLAIVIEEGETPVAGSWIAARAMSGAQMFAPKLKVPDEVATTVKFPNLTAGPAPTGAAHADAVGSLPSLPTSRRIHLEDEVDSAYSAPGFVSTPEQGSSVAERYRSSVRPILTVRRGSKVTLSFTAPARHLYVVVQRPNKSRTAGIAISHPRAEQVDENGLRWRLALPSSPSLEQATTIFVKCDYPGGIGRYRVGVRVGGKEH